MTDVEYENKRLLDIVSEEDEIIGSKPRTDVHRFGLLHREIHVWMFDKDHNIFFQKRGLHRPSAGLLDATVGGHVNHGDKYLDTAIRETKEETGISVSESDLVLLKKFRGSTNTSKEYFLDTINNFIRYIYIYKYPVDDKMIKKEEGIPGGGFQKLSRVFLEDLPKEHLNMFDKFILTDEIPLVFQYLDLNIQE